MRLFGRISGVFIRRGRGDILLLKRGFDISVSSKLALLTLKGVTAMRGVTAITCCGDVSTSLNHIFTDMS